MVPVDVAAAAGRVREEEWDDDDDDDEDEVVEEDEEAVTVVIEERLDTLVEEIGILVEERLGVPVEEVIVMKGDAVGFETWEGMEETSDVDMAAPEGAGRVVAVNREGSVVAVAELEPAAGPVSMLGYGIEK